MTGNANVELSIVGPTGRVMMSRPAALDHGDGAAGPAEAGD